MRRPKGNGQDSPETVHARYATDPGRSEERSNFLEILKDEAFGITAAVRNAHIRDRYRGSQSNKQRDKKKVNSMLNKLNKSRAGFTLVEIMIVVAIIALLAAIAVPGFLRARKRSQASKIINDLRLIDAAVDQYAIETNRQSGFSVGTTDWTAYMKKGSSLYNTGRDLFGNAYGAQTVDALPKTAVNTFAALSDVADANFFSPYGTQ